MKKHKLKLIKWQTKKGLNSGFTLIELMVATSIFVSIILVAMGSLIITTNAAKRAQALNFTMDNLSFAIESMSRSVRMGTSYHCNSTFTSISTGETRDCEGEKILAFTPAGEPIDSTRKIVYALALRDDGSGTYTIRRYEWPSQTYVDMVAENINVQDLKFFVRGSQKNDLTQPETYMIVKGSVTIKNEPISFAIQTMISQRTFE